MIKCQKCGHLNLDNDKFCGQCGNKLSEPANYCPNCNRTFNNSNKFCTQCGTKLIAKPSYSKPNYQKKNPYVSKKHHIQENNLEEKSSDEYIVKVNTNTKSKANNDTVVVIDNDERPDYSEYDDMELNKRLELAKDRHRDAIKARDISAPRYLKEIRSIEKELSSRPKNTYKNKSDDKVYEIKKPGRKREYENESNELNHENIQYLGASRYKYSYTDENGNINSITLIADSVEELKLKLNQMGIPWKLQ